MPASYPGAIKTFTNKTNKVDLVDAGHINDLQNEVTAVETELGINVRGSATDLVARLARALANNGAIANGTAFPTSPTPVDGQMFYRTDSDALYIYNGIAWDPFAATSNVIFSWRGIDTIASGTTMDYGKYFGNATNQPTKIASTFNYDFFCGSTQDDVTYVNIVPAFKWKKIPGINTLTVHIRAWSDGNNFTIRLDCGGQTGFVAVSTALSTPTWRTSFTVDVSGLINGTTYDVVLQAKNDAGVGDRIKYVSGFVIIGS